MVVNERHIKQARNKQRQIDRMDKVERPVLERRKMALRAAQRHARRPARGRAARRRPSSFGDEPILLGVDLTVMRGERVGVIGANGAGKSVLLRLLTGELEPAEGERWIGPSIQLGYLAPGARPALDATPRRSRPCAGPARAPRARPCTC